MNILKHAFTAVNETIYPTVTVGFQEMFVAKAPGNLSIIYDNIHTDNVVTQGLSLRLNKPSTGTRLTITSDAVGEMVIWLLDPGEHINGSPVGYVGIANPAPSRVHGRDADGTNYDTITSKPNPVLGGMLNPNAGGSYGAMQELLTHDGYNLGVAPTPIYGAFAIEGTPPTQPAVIRTYGSNAIRIDVHQRTAGSLKVYGRVKDSWGEASDVNILLSDDSIPDGAGELIDIRGFQSLRFLFSDDFAVTADTGGVFYVLVR